MAGEQWACLVERKLHKCVTLRCSPKIVLKQLDRTALSKRPGKEHLAAGKHGTEMEPSIFGAPDTNTETVRCHQMRGTVSIRVGVLSLSLFLSFACLSVCLLYLVCSVSQFTFGPSGIKSTDCEQLIVSFFNLEADRVPGQGLLSLAFQSLTSAVAISVSACVSFDFTRREVAASAWSHCQQRHCPFDEYQHCRLWSCSGPKPLKFIRENIEPGN